MENIEITCGVGFVKAVLHFVSEVYENNYIRKFQSDLYIDIVNRKKLENIFFICTYFYQT